MFITVALRQAQRDKSIIELPNYRISLLTNQLINKSILIHNRATRLRRAHHRQICNIDVWWSGNGKMDNICDVLWL